MSARSPMIFDDITKSYLVCSVCALHQDESKKLARHHWYSLIFFQQPTNQLVSQRANQRTIRQFGFHFKCERDHYQYVKIQHRDCLSSFIRDVKHQLPLFLDDCLVLHTVHLCWYSLFVIVPFHYRKTNPAEKHNTNFFFFFFFQLVCASRRL